MSRSTDAPPELAADVTRLRIPPSIDVPLSQRVRRVIDTSPMRRLAGISQLGLVALVYPGATHSRLEHSLGVYRNAVELLRHLRSNTLFFKTILPAVDAFLFAALVHDVGHWPFCHPIEDMGPMPAAATAKDASGRADRTTPRHEHRVDAMLRTGPLADCLHDDWSCSADDVMAILKPRGSLGETPAADAAASFFASCLSGPIDIDKLDYLQRDSLHAGVPYGCNFDPARVVASMRPHPAAPRLALDMKGRTAAEMMVFGRYVMFSEVYWHHAVRSATAMLQRALFELHAHGIADADWDGWVDLPDSAWVQRLRDVSASAGNPAVQRLVDGLFGPTRRLFKRIAEFNIESLPGPGESAGGSPYLANLHTRLARRPYWWMVACAKPLAVRIGSAIGQSVDPASVLIDAPPVKLEVDINMDVVTRSHDGQTRVSTLGDISPVVSVLANRQFDNHVKRVRVFVPAPVRDAMRSAGISDADVGDFVSQSADELETEVA